MIYPVHVDDRNLTVQVIETLDGLDKLGDSWMALLKASRTASSFMSWEWLYTWSEQFIRGERRLFVLAVFDGSELVGIAPWYTDNVAHGPLVTREIGFLGLPESGSDYLDVIARRGKERRVARSLLALLFGPLSSRWDTLKLRDIPSDSTFLVQFLLEIRRRGKHYIIEEGSFCPRVRLPATFEAYLGQMSGHGRRAYRRKMRALLANPEVEHVVLRDPQDAGTALALFRDLYERRWGRPADDLFGFIQRYMPRAHDGWRVEVSLLTVKGVLVAGLVHLTQGSRICQYLMAVERTFRKSLSVGNLMCVMSIQWAIEAGFAEYDFLKGEEDYKFQFMNSGGRALNLSLRNSTVRSFCAWTVDTASGFGKLLLR